MKSRFINITMVCACGLSCQSVTGGNELTPSMSFTENKGQVHDQHYSARPDVLYYGATDGLTYHLKKHGVSYQFIKTLSWRSGETGRSFDKMRFSDKLQIHRIDIYWEGANDNAALEARHKLPGYSNFYLTPCPLGATGVSSYQEVWYKGIYEGIDLRYYFDGGLKYDFIVAPGANYKQIKYRVEGARDIYVDTDGSLIIKTDIGTIKEDAPKIFQNGKVFFAKWVVHEEYITILIELYQHGFEMIIDPPVRTWGTYYGGQFSENGVSCVTDGNNDVYLSGTTESNAFTIIATSGAHQTDFGGGQDAYLAKFSSSGTRLWSTFYGGTGNDSGWDCCVDGSGNAFLVGTTTSTNGVIATLGVHQTSLAGQSDAFLVKFNSAGVRIFGTYYGGQAVDRGYTCMADPAGNVYIGGQTASQNSTMVVSTASCHQSTYGGGFFDCFLVKLTAQGARVWGTYLGGNLEDYPCNIAIDVSGNVYMSGATASTNNIATNAAYQTSYGGGYFDCFIVSFNEGGTRLYGTYYGGASTDAEGYISLDMNGNIYLVGTTSSSTGIASAGAYQGALGSPFNFDAFLARFDPTWTRIWATYYGGTELEYGYACTVDQSDYIYITGSTWSSGTVIATPGAHQTTLSGTRDALIAQFDNAGNRVWGTFYGGQGGYELGTGITTDCIGNLYVSGQTDSQTSTQIATTGAHQQTFGGGTNNQTDGFLVQFYECNIPSPPVNTTPSSHLLFCEGNTTTLSAGFCGSINWYTSVNGQVPVYTGAVLQTSSLSAGSYSWFAESVNNCTASINRTAIVVTVSPIPSISVADGSVCSGSSFTLTPSSGSINVTYTFSGGTAIVTPTSTSQFTISAVSDAGCTAPDVVANVTVHPIPVISLTAGKTTLCKGESLKLEVTGANSYTWNIPGVSGNPVTVTPSASVIYVVWGGNGFGCFSKDSVAVSVLSCTEIDNRIQEPGITIFPNPTEAEIYVESNERLEGTLIDPLGRSILNLAFEPGRTIISLVSIPKGIYYLVFFNKGTRSTRIIKQ